MRKFTNEFGTCNVDRNIIHLLKIQSNKPTLLDDFLERNQSLTL